MAAANFELVIDLQAEPDAVIDFLADLHHHRDLHPLIERIDDLPPEPGRPSVRRYRVTDRLRLGPLRFRIAYVAELERISAGELRGSAQQPPGIEVHTHYRAEPVAGGTRLRESAEVAAPRPLVAYVRRQARAAHRESLAKLAAHFRAGPGAESAPPPDPADGARLRSGRAPGGR